MTITPEIVVCVDCGQKLHTAKSRDLRIGPVCLSRNPGAQAVLAALTTPRIATPSLAQGGPAVAAGQLTIEEAISGDRDLP